VDVEPPEVDELARGVDLGLVGGLALPEHRRGVEGGPPRAGEQRRGLEEDRCAVVIGELAPHRRRIPRRRDGRVRVVDGAVVCRTEN
jgi:hypothetical protein